MQTGERESGMECAGSAQWQSGGGRSAAVLREVFAWLGGAELARAGAACRAWRSAAAEPALWRRLLLRRTAARCALLHAAEGARWCWRQEYVCAHAGWERAGSARVAGGAALLHAALAPDDAAARLALAADDASVSIWERAREGENSPFAWRECWRCSLREERGWAKAARVQWAGGVQGSRRAQRLLVAGPRMLADGWELLVLHIDEECRGRVVSRARCSAGAAGCWAGAGGDAFLSLELRLLAPRLACTSVWLNAATQETQSEHAGVRTRALQIFNEDGAHISHVVVAEIPQDSACAPTAPPAESPAEPPAPGADDDLNYYRAVCTPSPPRVAAGGWMHVVVCAWGAVDEGGGVVAAWPLRAPRPSPLCATTEGAGDLRARRRLRAERGAGLEEDAAPPDAGAVRALCDPPGATCALPARPLGLVVHPRGRCLWVSLDNVGAACVCVSLPALARLRTLRAPAAGAPLPPLPPRHPRHYVQPAVSEFHAASPAGSYSSLVHVWSALSGEPVAVVAAGQGAGRECAPVGCTLLSAAADGALTLLVLAGDELQVWRSRASAQPSRGW